MQWMPLAALKQKILGAGGFVNAHAHFDRAYSVTPADLPGANATVERALQEKWQLVDAWKRSTSEDDYFSHMTSALRGQQEFGVRTALTFVDCDPVAGTRALSAAMRAKEYAATQLQMRLLLACQTLKGVLHPEARRYFEMALEKVDVIGGLPGADKGREEEHLDVLLAAAKSSKKRVHVHVDQNNDPAERETEQLARAVIRHGLEGQVTAVHGISIACQTKAYRQDLYKLCRDAGLSFVACPGAWLDARRNETLTPTHNAVTPIDEMIPAGLCVALGSDNISDIYKPFADGDMMTELRMLLESTHFYDTQELVRIATDNGRRVLGLD
ncbi:MAG: amidohydrolase family protein [Betaproteobacteria bacterium]|nr:amidohydrolase family protein [Betaproteobacteria bacterium]